LHLTYQEQRRCTPLSFITLVIPIKLKHEPLVSQSQDERMPLSLHSLSTLFSDQRAVCSICYIYPLNVVSASINSHAHKTTPQQKASECRATPSPLITQSHPVPQLSR
jgi:hypothetical protein